MTTESQDLSGWRAASNRIYEEGKKYGFDVYNDTMNDTPLTDAIEDYLRIRNRYEKTDHQVWFEHSQQLERDLNELESICLEIYYNRIALNHEGVRRGLDKMDHFFRDENMN